MSQWQRFISLWGWIRRYLLRPRIYRYPIISIAIIFMFIFVAIFANSLSPYPPNVANLSKRLVPPFWQAGGSVAFLLGTDELGRDIVSRIIFGARVSLVVALFSIVVGGLGGTALGIIAGYRRGWVDVFLMRTADATLAFPFILIAMMLAVALGPSMQNVIFAISIALWGRYARVVRGEVLSLKEREFVALARVAGCSNSRIMFRHIFPNVLNTVVVMITYQVGWVIGVEASLSFLGAGIPPPTPSWGSMIAKGREFIVTAWWLCGFPGMAIVVVVLAFNLVGDWLREALDPKLRQVAGGI
jgi:peptide/nickel transport system permease protein